MKKNSINTNIVGLQEIEDSDEEEHIITNRKEDIWAENNKLYRKFRVENVKRYYEAKKRKPDESVMKRVVVNSEEHVDEYNLIEISEDELRMLRKYQIPTFILKDNGKYFYTQIPRDLNLIGSVNVEHRCSPRTSICTRLSPCSDSNGGCRKVRDVKKRLEKYAWIKSGYETINTDFECFVVIKCEHQNLVNANAYNTKVLGEAMLKLASFIWDDVDSVAEMTRRINRNISK